MPPCRDNHQLIKALEQAPKEHPFFMKTSWIGVIGSILVLSFGGETLVRFS